MPASREDLLHSFETLRLMRAFNLLRHAGDRRTVIELAERMARSRGLADGEQVHSFLATPVLSLAKTTSTD